MGEKVMKYAAGYTVVAGALFGLWLFEPGPIGPGGDVTVVFVSHLMGCATAVTFWLNDKAAVWRAETKRLKSLLNR